MSRQHGIKCSTMVALVGFIAAAFSWPAVTSAERISVGPAVTGTEHTDGNHLQGVSQAQKTADLRSKDLTYPMGLSIREHLMIVRPSCPAPAQNFLFPFVSFFSDAAMDGDWVFFAGLSWENDSGYREMDPDLIQASTGKGLTNWYYTVEMLFIPRDNWSIRASLAFDSSDIHDALAAPSQKLNPLQFGVAISFDYGKEKPMVLDLGYGRLPLDVRVLTVQSRSVNALPAHLDDDPPEANVVSACLNIQF